jgi:hypothetical protein
MVADPKLMEVSDGAVIVGSEGSRDDRPLTSTLGIEKDGSDDIVGRMSVTPASIEPRDDSPRLVGKLTKEDGRPVSNVIGGSKVPVRLVRSETALVSPEMVSRSSVSKLSDQRSGRRPARSQISWARLTMSWA